MGAAGSLRRGVFEFWDYGLVDMIGHRPESGQGEVMDARILGKNIQIDSAIRIAIKGLLAMVSLLGDMMGSPGHN